MKKYKHIFVNDKIYTENEIVEICDKYNLIITDCIKDDGEITIGLDKDDEPCWEFSIVTGDHLTFNRTFKLRWTEFI